MAEKKKKLPSTFFNMVMVLTVIALISALALGFTYSGTKDAIAMVEVKRTLKALNEVLPQFENDPNAEKYTLEDEAYKDMEFFPARNKEGQLIGTAVRTFSDNGFNERIWLIVGFTSDNKINNISVVKHKETPGLGTKMQDAKFKDQFKGIDPTAFKLKVKKDGGDVDAFSAATISSRAFCEATDKAYLALKNNKPVSAPPAPVKEEKKEEVKKDEGVQTSEGGDQ